MPRPVSRTSSSLRVADGAAVCLSAACLVHCLAVPLLLSVSPWVVPGLFRDEAFHLFAVALALPVSAFGIGLGLRQHRRPEVLLLAAAGLLAMAAGALAAPTERFEVLLTVAGVSSLALAHLRNWQLREWQPAR